MLKLPNGKEIDKDMVEVAMEDSDLSNSYYLNLQTGEVAFLTYGDENEELSEEIEGSDDYVPIERIPSHEAYQWMENFVADMVAPKDPQAAEKLSIALMGKGAFRRFKDVLHTLDDKWEQAWYRWRDERLEEAMNKWLEDVFQVIGDDLL